MKSIQLFFSILVTSICAVSIQAFNQYTVTETKIICVPLDEAHKNPFWYKNFEENAENSLSTGLYYKTNKTTERAEGLQFVYEYITPSYKNAKSDAGSVPKNQVCRVYYYITPKTD